jgi:hypothetical protein
MSSLLVVQNRERRTDPVPSFILFLLFISPDKRISYENCSIQTNAGIVTTLSNSTINAAAPEGTPPRRIGD